MLNGLLNRPALSDVKPSQLDSNNIGWNSESKKPHHTKEGLAKEICDMVQELISISISISIPIAIAIYIYIYSYSYLYL